MGTGSDIGLLFQSKNRRWWKKGRVCTEGGSLPNSILSGSKVKVHQTFDTALHTIMRERNVLFNDALNTFYLRLYGVRHIVKDHSDSEKGNPLPPHRLLLSINSKGSFICTIPQTG